MKDEEVWMRDEIQSPCVKICVIHPAEHICTGCFRTIQEISGWARMSHEERAALMTDLPDRASRLKARRGGRAARLKRG
ncbi:DUF1289 domain-containing protein [Sagittula salina]|uniref:DUF1289 domain-containing protein n=1 Tax=Sagittula salina TaxID=2820268 RepID=A0A940MN02_9RHOB|nr:DUF1289 domain-containing protein [Sagittula salina]MBP0481651.1 DUF1289 domain-containing protein [Sagittula salina]